jgi:hypothetical protein
MYNTTGGYTFQKSMRVTKRKKMKERAGDKAKKRGEHLARENEGDDHVQ